MWVFLGLGLGLVVLCVFLVVQHTRDYLDCANRGGRYDVVVGTYWTKYGRQKVHGCTVPTSQYPTVRPSIYQ